MTTSVSGSEIGGGPVRSGSGASGGSAGPAGRPWARGSALHPSRRRPGRSRGGARSSGSSLGAWTPPFLVLVVLVAVWQAVTTLARISPIVLPGPRLVVSATWDDRSDLWPAVVTTTEEAVVGLLLAVLVAFAVGIAVDASRWVRRSVYPLVVAFQTLPIIAIAPLVLIWFGFGIHPKIVLVGLFSFFPITVGVIEGLGQADRDALRLARSLRATRSQILWRVRLPGALPQVFTGLRIAVTYSFTAAIVAEFVGATQGLGKYMTDAATAAPTEPDLVLGATAVTAVLTVLLYGLVGVIQRVAMPWRPPPGEGRGVPAGSGREGAR